MAACLFVCLLVCLFVSKRLILLQNFIFYILVSVKNNLIKYLLKLVDEVEKDKMETTLQHCKIHNVYKN